MNAHSGIGVWPVDQDPTVNPKRRRVLVATATVVGGAGIVASAYPFIASMRPIARSRAADAPVNVDLDKIEPAQQIVVKWRGKLVWILRRTESMIENLGKANLLGQLRDPDSNVTSQQPSYAKNRYRAIEPEYFVAVAICTHLGCSPTFRPEVVPSDLGSDWLGGYFCPCHGSRFDLAGRVYRGVPAPTNLVVPSYQFLSESVIWIGG